MSTYTIFEPSGLQHKRLHQLSIGGEDTPVDPEGLGPIYNGDDLEKLAWDFYHMEKRGRRGYELYMDINEPAATETGWIVRKELTPLGKQALSALDVGWFWNPQDHCENVQATFDFYRKLMKNGKFSIKHADWITGNADDRFRELRNEVVYFKLKSKRVGEYFIEDDDAK